MMTLSPQSMWGVKDALCLPRKRIATIDAKRPRTMPSASIRIHFLSMSAGVAENVFIEGYPWFYSFCKTDCSVLTVMGGLYRLFARSQGRAININLAKTISYKIGIKIPHNNAA